MIKRGMLLLVVFTFLVFTIEVDSKIQHEMEELFGSNTETGVIIILNKNYTSAEEKDKILKSFDWKNSYSNFNAISGRITKSDYEKLKNGPFVQKIIKDNIRSFALDSSVIQVNATNVWRLIYSSINITGKGESICVVDSGIDYTHPSLGSCTTSQFLNGTCNKVVAGFDFKNNDNDPIDDQGHGTHVAGIIASTNETYRGIAPGSTLIAMKVCDNSATGNCFDSDIIAAIDWCTSNATKFNISAISMSLGGGLYSSYCDDESAEAGLKVAIDNAVAKNISVIVASGNGDPGSTTQISSPACLKNSTAVGSVTKQNSISGFSNRNGITDLFAPGSSITSTVPKNGCILCDASGYKALSGTSMSAPHVAGAFALLRHYKKLEQNTILTPAEIQYALNYTGKQIDDTSGSGLVFSRINVYAALLSLDKDAPNITLVAPTPANNTNILIPYFIINLTSNEFLSSAMLEYNSINQTLNQTDILLNWMINKTSGFGVFNYRIYGNDSSGNMRITPLFQISINNSAPNITSFYPQELNISISEQNNIVFNITANDINNDQIIIAWYQNGTLKSIANKFVFFGNLTSSGIYNITVEVSDSSLSNSLTWNLTVNNANIAPNITIVSISNSDYLNRTNGTLQAYWNFSDAENDAIILNETLWYLNETLAANYTNKTSIHQINTTKLENWTFSVRVFDGANWSDFRNSSTIKIVNAAPSLNVNTTAIILSETQQANISFDAYDLDNDFLDYAINNSRLFRQDNYFIWNTNLNDSGFYQINITVNDNSDIDSILVNLTINDASDIDNDGNPDFNDTDKDDDGVNDNTDYLIGNTSVINSTIQNLSILIGNSTNLSQIFNGSFIINFTQNNFTVISFNFNFSMSSTLDLSKLTINMTSNGSSAVSIRGLRLFNSTKTVFLEKINLTASSVCINDADFSFDSISSSCDSANETLVICNNSSNGQYACFDSGMKYMITGLSHSAVKELCRDEDGDGFGTGCVNGEDCNDNDASKTTDCSSPSSGGNSGGGSSSGGGGGSSGSGGGGFAFICNQDWKCSEWTNCVDGLQTRECGFIKVAQHAQETQCPTADDNPATSQNCEIPKTLSLASENCNDFIQNQNEEAVDCGGVCLPCEKANTASNRIMNNETARAARAIEQPTGFSVKNITGGKIGALPAIFIASALILAFAGFAIYKRNNAIKKLK